MRIYSSVLELEAFLIFFRHNSEPDVNLRLGNRSVESSTISMPGSSVVGQRPDPEGAPATDDSPTPALPGPSQVVTHPGVSGRDPATGQRQRRIGVSGPPTGV